MGRRTGDLRPGHFGPEIAEEVTQVMIMLIRERRRLRVSATELARRMGITQSTLCNMESLLYLPSLGNLMRYAHGLGLKLNVTTEKKGDT